VADRDGAGVGARELGADGFGPSRGGEVPSEPHAAVADATARTNNSDLNRRGMMTSCRPPARCRPLKLPGILMLGRPTRSPAEAKVKSRAPMDPNDPGGAGVPSTAGPQARPGDIAAMLEQAAAAGRVDEIMNGVAWLKYRRFTTTASAQC
jgi:hypothetical protein